DAPANGFVARSWSAPTVTVYVVEKPSGADGVDVTIEPLTTGAGPAAGGLNAITPATVFGFMASLNVTVILALTGTPVAPTAGFRSTSVGGVMSCVDAVVKVHVAPPGWTVTV